MKALGLLLVSILVMSAFLGCIELGESYCNIISYSIIDNDGRIAIKLLFNSTGSMTFKSIDPSGKKIDEISTLSTFGEVTLNLSPYHKNPEEGTYKIKIYDTFGKKVKEIPIDMEKPFLNIRDVNVTWWKEGKNSYSMVEMRINVENPYDIPVYLDKVLLKIEDELLETKVLEDTIAPGYGNVTLSLYLPSFQCGEYNISISITDLDDNILGSGFFSISPTLYLKQSRFSKSWKFDGKTYSLTIPIPSGLYNYCSLLPRPYLEDYSFYAIDPKVQGFVEMLAEKLKSMYGGKDLIDFIASFAQNIEYRSESGEYPKYPIELLHDGYGDCEDKAILVSSILYKLGYDVCLIRFEDHMAVGVHLDDFNCEGKVYYTDEIGKNYLYLETSNKGWKIGEADANYAHVTNYTIYHVTDKPILVQVCKPPVRHQIGNEDYIDLTSTIINIGSRDAKIAKLRVKVEVYGNEIVVAESETVSVAAGEGQDIYLKFNTPGFSFSEIHVTVVNDNREVARSSFVFL